MIMGSKNTVPDLENDLSPEEEAKRADQYKAYMAEQAAKNKAAADAAAAKAAGRDSGIASLIKDLGKDSEDSRAIAQHLYDTYGISSMADIGQSDPYAYNDPGEYVQTSTGDSGEAGYWAREPGERQVTSYTNKKTGEKIGHAPGTLDLGSRYIKGQGTISYYMDDKGKIQQSFMPQKESHGLWDYGLGDFLKFANMVPGLQAFTTPIMAARALNNGNIGQALAALAPKGLEALGASMMPQGPYLAGSTTGKMLESLTGIQGLPADILAGGLKGAGIAALTGQDVGGAALMGAINPAMKAGMKELTGAIDASGKQDFLNRYESDLAGDDINGKFSINNTITPELNTIDQQGLTDISPEQRLFMENTANKLAMDTQLGDLTGGADQAERDLLNVTADDENVKNILADNEEAKNLESIQNEQKTLPSNKPDNHSLFDEDTEADKQLRKINEGVVPTEAPKDLNLMDNQEYDDSVKIEAPEGPKLETVTIRPGPDTDDEQETLPVTQQPSVPTIPNLPIPPIKTGDTKPVTKPPAPKPPTPKLPDYSNIIAGLIGGMAAKKIAESQPEAPVGLPAAAQTFNWGYKAKEGPKDGVTYGHQYFSPTWGQPAKPAFDEGGIVNFQSMPDPGITVSDLTMPSDNPTVMPSSYNQTMPTFAQGGAAKMGGEQFLKAAHEAGLPTDRATLNQIVDLVNHGIPLHTAAKMIAEQANKGIASLGGFSDGGRMLKGPGDGMSDDIPATIAGKQPARLANEEFVIPADVVSHLGNGSSEAGSRVLYDMMARVRKARTGNPKQGKKINPHKFMPR